MVGIPVTLKSGEILTIVPARRTALQILSGSSWAEDGGYGIIAERTRDQGVAYKRGDAGALDDADWDELIFLAVRSGYDITREELIAANWIDPVVDPVLIARAAWGVGMNDKARQRALALVVAGIGDMPLSAAESSFICDWIWNSKSAPLITGEG